MHFRRSRGWGFRAPRHPSLAGGSPAPLAAPGGATGSEPDPRPGEGLRLLPLGCPPPTHRLFLRSAEWVDRLRRLRRPATVLRPPPPALRLLCTSPQVCRSLRLSRLPFCFRRLRCKESLYTALRAGFKSARAPCDPGVLRCCCLRSALIFECRSAELSGPGPVYRPGALP
ncbi:hypothetical protein NDU88_003746 [Pleurodeles waltl]|uniref:Uncharacterized protein n=1 Tax=Pleurodeles waltl TaxID=8319 RepID=A0AAV7QE13_PLEWA|nr:hypothetical protein NDU88_003746 [Pleurodeles waltl]